MNVELISILNNYGQFTVQQIQQNLSSTGTNATGKTSASLKYSVKNEGTKATLLITGRKYFATVETGRKATPNYDKPSKAFVQAIKEWAEAKGVDSKFAYAIAKSIHKKGTKLFRDGGRNDVVSNVVNQGLVDEISKDLLDKFAQLFLKDVVKIFRDGNHNFTTA
jgi:hypothetical protein